MRYTVQKDSVYIYRVQRKTSTRVKTMLGYITFRMLRVTKLAALIDYCT